jgi:hypothetical protein
MNDIIVPDTPRLPNATTEYDRMAQEQYSNVLRLFFNQLVNALGQIVASSSNNESTTSADFMTQVARGKVTGASQVNLFAFSTNVPAFPNYYTLWENTGTTQYAFPASAVVMTLASTSASDNAQATVLISGLDSTWALQTETVTLNGTTNVTTAKSFLRINSMILTSPGAGQTSNVGVITAKNGGVTYAQMNAGIGKNQAAVYSVPNGYTLYLYSINAFNGDSAASGYINYQVKSTNNALTNPVTLTVLQTSWDTAYQVERINPFPYTQKTDVQWQFATNSGVHHVGLILQGILIDNTAA